MKDSSPPSMLSVLHILSTDLVPSFSSVNSLFQFFCGFAPKCFKNYLQGHVSEGVDLDHQKVKRECFFLHCV